MGRYQAYVEYKGSDIDWLDLLPAHWGQAKIKFYYDIQLGRMLQPQPNSTEDEEVDYLKALNVQWEYVDIGDLPKMWTSPKDKRKYAVKNGDLLVCEGGEVGRTALLKDLDGDCIIQNALHRVRGSEKSSIYYLKYLMRHIADAGWFNILCNKATIAHLTGEKLGSLGLPLPSMEEQQLIARFLDYKTAQIDALIAKKEALLAKLAEKRTALISHAVTKGLDPTMPMKDSGIEWLGEIPTHWDTPSLSTRYSSELGKMLNESRISGEYLIPYLKNVDVQWDFINQSDLPLMDIHPKEYDRYLVKPGDILVCEGGEVGRAAIVPKIDYLLGFQKAIHRLRAQSTREVPRFLFYTLYWASHIGVFVTEGNPNTIAHLTGEKLRRYKFPTPSFTEQLAIVQYLDKQTEQIDQQQARIQKAIDKLKEYRTALITNAVTGKIDVRNVPIPALVPAEAADVS